MQHGRTNIDRHIGRLVKQIVVANRDGDTNLIVASNKWKQVGEHCAGICMYIR